MKRSPRKTRAWGMPDARCTRSLACEWIVKHTSVVTTGPPESPGIPARNGFNGLFRALPGERIRLVTVISGFQVLPDPVGPDLTSASLTPATGARTTRLCRPRPVYAKGFDGPSASAPKL